MSKEKELIEEKTKKFKLRKKEIFQNTDYIEKVLCILKRKDFICNEPSFEEEMVDLTEDEKKALSELPIFWDGICDYTAAHHIWPIMRIDEKIKLGYARASRIIKCGDELINISVYQIHNPDTDYHNTDKYYYGCSISDDAKRRNNYYEFDLEDVINFHIKDSDKPKILQK